MDKLLYKTPLAAASQTDESDTLESQLVRLGLLEGDGAVVNQLSSEAPDLSLAGQFRAGPYLSELHATELEELANSALDALPLFRVDESYSKQGYYEIASATVEPAQANDRRIYTWDLDLVERGTQNTHYRAIAPNPRGPGTDGGVDHEFGNDVSATVAIPSSARKTQWYDAETGDREIATPTDTVESEFGTLDVYDLEDCSWYEIDVEGESDAPLLLYDVPYADEAPTDVKIYDTRGQDAKYLESDEGDGRVRVWQSVFSTGHDPEGEIVLDNGVLRLWIDEDDGTVDAREWDDSTEEWTALELADAQPTDVDLFDVDVASIGAVRTRVQLTFDVSALDTPTDRDLFALDVILATGHDAVLVTISDGEEGPIPDDLEDWLEPIASESLVDAQPSKTLISRNEVSK